MISANDAPPARQGVVLSSGTGGASGYAAYHDGGVRFDVQETGPGFSLNLHDADIFLVPNGSDHVALSREREEVSYFLGRGGTLICVDGWVEPWLPGNAWIMDNAYRTIDVRYQPGTDDWGLLDGVDIEALTFRHGISGWWACGYIEPAAGADVILKDSWGRAIVVVDAVSTNGLMVLTASGPVGPWSEEGRDTPSADALNRLYDNMLRLQR